MLGCLDSSKASSRRRRSTIWAQNKAPLLNFALEVDVGLVFLADVGLCFCLRLSADAVAVGLVFLADVRLLGRSAVEVAVGFALLADVRLSADAVEVAVRLAFAAARGGPGKGFTIMRITSSLRGSGSSPPIVLGLRWLQVRYVSGLSGAADCPESPDSPLGNAIELGSKPQVAASIASRAFLTAVRE